MDLLAHLNKAPGWFDPANPGNFGFVNSDMAFQGDHAFIGNFNGFQIYDISNPAAPALQTLSSARAARATCRSTRTCCSCRSRRRARRRTARSTPPADATTRFRGVRIFDISNLNAPEQVVGPDLPRLAHAHARYGQARQANVYIYVQGTSGVRPPRGARRLRWKTPEPTGPNPSKWRIEVIKVPVAAPQQAAVVNEPRLFRDQDDRRGQRPPERAADAAASFRILGAHPDHRRLP